MSRSSQQSRFDAPEWGVFERKTLGIGALQHLDLTGVCQYIRWLPQIFVQADASDMTFGFFHHWP